MTRPLMRTDLRLALEFGTADPNVTQRALAALNSGDPRSRLLALVALGDGAAPVEAVDQVATTWSSFDDPWTRNAALRVAAADTARAFGRGAGTLDLELARRAARRRDTPACAAIVSALAAAKTPGFEVLDILARDLPAEARPALTPKLRAALQSLLDSTSIDVASAALRLAQRWDAKGELADASAKLGERLAAILADAQRDRAARTAALATLLTLPERRAAALEQAAKLLDPAAALEDAQKLVGVLGACEDPAAARVLARSFPALSGKLQDAIFEKLAARASWSSVLLDEIEAQRIDPRTLGAQKQHRLRNSADAGVAARAQKLFAGGDASSAQIDALIAKLLPEVDKPGDAVHGKAVFTENCAPCHTANGAGGKVGPDITGMGSHGAAALLPSILDPSRTVEAAYVEWSLTTKDDQLVSGVLARESADSVLLRWNGGEKEVARSEIEALKNTGRSPMPVGLEKIGADGLRDVIAYLSQGTEGFRVLSLGALCSRNSLNGIYDHRHANEVLKPRHFGLSTVFGVPFEALDPARTPSGNNVIVMKGGTGPDWDCRLTGPMRVEIPVGCAVQQVHVLGGIAAWGYPFHREKTGILKWTWKYQDGSSEEVVLHNGVEFGDWIARNDVPGSAFVEGFLADDSWGQVRFHSLAPKKNTPVASIVLESYEDSLFAPTIVAMTAELPGTRRVVIEKAKPRTPVALDVLVIGGGSSHDFATWFGEHDLATLKKMGLEHGYYTEKTEELRPQLPLTKVLVLTNNQPLEGDELHGAILDFVAGGGGLLLVHPATWYNWPDWPSYNRELVGGGAKSHEAYAEFDVVSQASGDELCEDVPTRFTVADELYRTELVGDGNRVLAVGRSRSSGQEFPVLWTRTLGKGRIVCLTLGHDGAAHDSEAYQRIYQNAVRWLLEGRRAK